MSLMQHRPKALVWKILFVAICIATGSFSYSARANQTETALPEIVISHTDTALPKIVNGVMGQLNIVTDWDAFRLRMRTLKANGVQVISTDVWWAIVELEEGVFDWSYYRHYVQILEDEGLLWNPNIAFHKKGGNVGDGDKKTDIPLREWVRKKFPDAFQSMYGQIDDEYIGYWNKGAYRLYGAVMKSFAENFADKAHVIHKTHVSLGPAGELRFPSYNEAFGVAYPEIGVLPIFSPGALENFREFLREEFHNDINALNLEWGSKIAKFDYILPPTDGSHFFKNGWKTPYGRTFLKWYQGVLAHHAENMFVEARKYLKGPLGAKWAGIHWLIGDPVHDRPAEKAAGYGDYELLMKVFAKYGIDLSFTCLEMVNNNSFPIFSLPEVLLEQIVTLANKYNVKIDAENALKMGLNVSAYRNARQALIKYKFAELNFLRDGDLVNDDGTERPEMHLFREVLWAPQINKESVIGSLNSKGVPGQVLQALRECEFLLELGVQHMDPAIPAIK